MFSESRVYQRVPPGVLCKRRGILYFAGGLLPHYRSVVLREGVARVPVRLRAAYCTNFACI